MNRPNLCETGTVLFVGPMPPTPGGASIVHRNLIACFDDSSIVVATAGNHQGLAMQYERENKTHEVLRSVRYSSRVNARLHQLQVPIASKRLARLVRKVDARVIIGAYPTIPLLDVARRAAKLTATPWIAYLHDTLAEATCHLPEGKRISVLQDAVLREASHLLVMSEGMSDLYRGNYQGMETTALEHIYPLPLRTELPDTPFESKAFWAGNVYAINAQSFGRMAEAVRDVGIGISMTTPKNLSVLQDMGVNTSPIERVYYPDWSDYHDALNEHEVLLLALDWPDESPIHRDELATIFPTKTPEYLASGRPILVHCPEHYFLARFFREHSCGTVVSEKSPLKLAAAFREIRAGGPDIRARAENALKATAIFRPERISSRLKAIVDAVANVEWGQRVEVDLRDS